MLNGTEKIERRNAPDRRQKPSDLFSVYKVSGRQRRIARRREDNRKHLIADVYSSRLWLKLLSLYALSLIDAYLTILLINLGIAEEINPIMAFYLGYGSRSFVMIKVMFTAAPLFLLCLSKDFSMTKITLKSSIMIYLIIVIYELSIIFEHSPFSYF